MLIADEMGLGKTLQVYTLSLEFWIIIHHFVMHFISFYIRLNLKLIQHTMFGLFSSIRTCTSGGGVCLRLVTWTSTNSHF